MNIAAEVKKSFLCIENLFSEPSLLCNWPRLLLQIDANGVNCRVIVVWVYIVNVTLAAKIENCQLTCREVSSVGLLLITN